MEVGKEAGRLYEAKGVTLGIRDKERDKNFMVVFDAKTKKEAYVYNWATEEILAKHKLSPFHQIGSDPRGENTPGYHGWEIWKDISKDELEKLLPEIEARAQEIVKELGGVE